MEGRIPSDVKIGLEFARQLSTTQLALLSKSLCTQAPLEACSAQDKLISASLWTLILHSAKSNAKGEDLAFMLRSECGFSEEQAQAVALACNQHHGELRKFLGTSVSDFPQLIDCSYSMEMIHEGNDAKAGLKIPNVQLHLSVLKHGSPQGSVEDVQVSTDLIGVQRLLDHVRDALKQVQMASD
jgi:hypothetical protein